MKREAVLKKKAAETEKARADRVRKYARSLNVRELALMLVDAEDRLAQTPTEQSCPDCKHPWRCHEENIVTRHSQYPSTTCRAQNTLRSKECGCSCKPNVALATLDAEGMPGRTHLPPNSRVIFDVGPDDAHTDEIRVQHLHNDRKMLEISNGTGGGLVVHPVVSNVVYIEVRRR